MSLCFLFELTPDEFPNFPLVSQNKKLKIQLYILHRFDRQPWLSLHTLSLSQASCVLLEGNDKSFPASRLMNYLVNRSKVMISLIRVVTLPLCRFL